MINMNNIPGLEETPNDLNSAYDKCVVFEIVDRFADENDFSKIDGMTRRAQVYKKLLDNQRELLEMVLLIHTAIYGSVGFDKKLLESKIIKIVEKITSVSWEELNE